MRPPLRGFRPLRWVRLLSPDAFGASRDGPDAMPTAGIWALGVYPFRQQRWLGFDRKIKGHPKPTGRHALPPWAVWGLPLASSLSSPLALATPRALINLSLLSR